MRLLNLLTASLLLGSIACSSDRTTASASPARTSFTHVLASTHEAPHAAVAAASIETLSNLVAQGDPKVRGFNSIEEVSLAVPASSLPMYQIGLDALREYASGQDPHEILIDEGAAMYPLTVGGDVRTSVIVKKRDGGRWEAASFGHANLAKAAHAHRKNVAVARGVEETAQALVQIPTLSARLLAHEEKGVLMLTAVLDIPGTTVHAGETQRADELLSMLQPLAARIDPNVPN